MKAYESVVINGVGEKRSSWRELALFLSCVNLCLLAAGFAYVAVLQGQVAALRNDVGLRREFGRTGASPSEDGGETKGGPMKVQVTQSPNKTPPRSDDDFGGMSPTHRPHTEIPLLLPRNRNGIKALHMEGDLPHGASSFYLDHVLRHWRATEWTKRNFAYFYHYNHNTGTIEVKESGLYLIYSQITTNTSFPRTGYNISVNGEPRMVCVDQAPITDSKLALIRSCSTSGVTVLHRGETVAIGSSYRGMQVLMKPRLSYWGMVKLSDN